jgi:YrbI family 3-deoxy-D-manno-octulosonate 8-phosphate phosphatase
MNLQRNLHRLLQARGVNRYRLAKDLELAPGRPAEWESGKAPTPDELIALADYFQVSIDLLLRGEVRRPAPTDIKMLVVDVDGVLTDGGMYFSENGDEIKKFHTQDGRGLIEIQKKGIHAGIISGGLRGEAIFARAERMGVARVYVGTVPKTQVMDGWLKDLGLQYEDIAYIGDDLNDLGIIEKSGFTACPADAVQAVKEKVDVILSKNGGRGCVREFIDLYIGI